MQKFSARAENGYIYANFSRLINTGDSKDKPLEDPVANNCQHFMFPATGGPIAGNSDQYVIEQHINTPKVKLVCNIARCRPNAAPFPRETTPISIGLEPGLNGNQANGNGNGNEIGKPG